VRQPALLMSANADVSRPCGGEPYPVGPQDLGISVIYAIVLLEADLADVVALACRFGKREVVAAAQGQFMICEGIDYAANGTARARARACESRASITRAA
jgi:hypothetical protein